VKLARPVNPAKRLLALTKSMEEVRVGAQSKRVSFYLMVEGLRVYRRDQIPLLQGDPFEFYRTNYV
jgi:hypothetical protein